MTLNFIGCVACLNLPYTFKAVYTVHDNAAVTATMESDYIFLYVHCALTLTTPFEDDTIPQTLTIPFEGDTITQQNLKQFPLPTWEHPGCDAGDFTTTL